MQANGRELIRIERRRQVSEEGYSAAHDDEHGATALARAAKAYELAMSDAAALPKGWPWKPSSWKPRGRRENLVRAGALFLAAAECADRAGSIGMLYQVDASRCADAIDALDRDWAEHEDVV